MMLDAVSSFDPEFAAPSDWAMMYRACGVQVVPARYPMLTASDKRPDLASWTEFHNELTSQPVFDRWFPPAAKPNMGAITGAASGNLLVIDLDEYKSTESTDWWHDLTFGIQQETWQQRTGGGGRQIFYRLPPGVVIGNCATHGMGIDIRGQAGFALLPPTMHMSGSRYEWLPGCAPWEIDCEVAPQKIIDAVQALIAEHGGGVSQGGHERTATPENVTDAFGATTDGREAKITRMVWARLRDLRKACPILPTEADLQSEFDDLWKAYERTTKTRLKNVGNADGLEREGRGITAVRDHWQRALKKWDTSIAEAAEQPDKRVPLDDKTAPEPPPRPIDPETGKPLPLILSAAQFVAGFTPPLYLVDGILQRGYLYSLTARTGHGKTAVTMFLAQAVARGVPVKGHDVEQGSVLILAGENPDDVRARFLVLAEKHGFDPASVPIHFIAGIVDIEAELPRIKEEAAAIDRLMLVIVDTAAAYFKGDDGNSNAQQGAYARLLRKLTFLPGKPAVMVNAHPIKNATKDNLVPVGGGAFLNEVDGNLTLWSNAEKQTIFHWQGKFRGPEFDPLTFKIEVAQSDKVADANGVLMPSVVAVPISDIEQELAEDAQRSAENVVLAVIGGNAALSIRNIARKAGYVSSNGQPQISKVQRIIGRLAEAKLVADARGKYKITKAGKQELGWGDDDE